MKNARISSRKCRRRAASPKSCARLARASTESFASIRHAASPIGRKIQKATQRKLQRLLRRRRKWQKITANGSRLKARFAGAGCTVGNIWCSYWMRDDKGKATKKFKHICWDGCMFPNEVMMKQQTWNDILTAMIQVRENHGWKE